MSNAVEKGKLAKSAHVQNTHRLHVGLNIKYCPINEV